MSNIVLLELVGVCVIGYLLGSISFGVLAGHYYGVDPLKKGSKNPGATNVTRLMGPAAGRFVFAFDFLKGVCATGWPMLPFLNTVAPLQLAMLGCAAAIVGHSYSMFLDFKGGKAVCNGYGRCVCPYATWSFAGYCCLVWRVPFNEVCVFGFNLFCHQFASFFSFYSQLS